MTKFSMSVPESEIFEVKKIVKIQDKSTGEITTQYYDKDGNLVCESTCDKNGKTLETSVYKQNGSVKITAEYGILTDENGEYFGVERYVISDAGSGNRIPLTSNQYHRAKDAC